LLILDIKRILYFSLNVFKQTQSFQIKKPNNRRTCQGPRRIKKGTLRLESRQSCWRKPC